MFIFTTVRHRHNQETIKALGQTFFSEIPSECQAFETSPMDIACGPWWVEKNMHRCHKWRILVVAESPAFICAFFPCVVFFSFYSDCLLAKTLVCVFIVCALVHALFRPQTKTHFEDTFLSGRVRERRREDTFRRHIKRRRISPRRRITPRRHISKTH